MKDLGMGLRMGKVFGTRILVQPIESYTEMDRVKKEGLLVIPKAVEEANRPRPCMGIVMQLGEALKEKFEYCGLGKANRLPEEWPLQEGFYVMFSKYAGTEFYIEQVEYRMLEAKEIMCTMTCDNPEAYAPVVD